MSARLGHGYFITHLLCNFLLFSQSHHTDKWLQAETQVSDNGEELTCHRTMVGCIFKIAVTKSCLEYVIMEVFNILESRDRRYGMPAMHGNPNQRYQVVQPSVSCIYSHDVFLIAVDQSISFIINVQHDCEGGKCEYEIDETGPQDGQPVAKIERRIVHSTHDKYFINLHALHNAWRLRETLPRTLTEPVPYIPNREEFHYEMAKKLQKANPKKRARAKEKAKDTRERKRRAIESTGGIEDVQSEDEADPAL